MFVTVARVVLQIPESGSLKAKRQVLRRITDRVKARFNVSVAEVDDNDLWQKAQLALAVVGNERRHVVEQMEKILHFIEDLYVAPIISRETETLSFGDELYGGGAPRAVGDPELTIPSGQRSLAEAEGLGDWSERHEGVSGGARSEGRSGKSGGPPRKLSLEEVRARARALRNPRDWEKK
ncbi:MAG TPA: DUF503 domain-containing protein [Myxococcaceae bacterium]|nr:DUF503 domain-containing protein [Myxococcaceae bacterium]